MHVLVRQGIEKPVTVCINSILIAIEDFRKLVDEKFKVEPERQRLFFRGREVYMYLLMKYMLEYMLSI